MASPDDQTAAMIRNLEERTGKPMAHWLKVVASSGLSRHGEVVKHLKSDHGLTHGYANLVAHEAKGSAAAHADDADLVQGQYAGKEHLLPIYEKLAAAAGSFGNDVELAPKKSYVSLRRARQFGLIQPSTKTRVDVGIQLKGTPPTERLEASGSFNAMVSHRVRVSSGDEIDAEIIAWLREAYDAAD